MATELPRLPRDVNVIIIEKSDGQGGYSEDLRVRRHHIEVWLNYLRENSRVPEYRNLRISQANLDSLPVDGVPDDLRRIVDDNIDVEEPLRDPDSDEIDLNNIPSVNTGVCIPPNQLPTQEEAIEAILNGLQGWYY